jgi:hypothetical protein
MMTAGDRITLTFDHAADPAAQEILRLLADNGIDSDVKHVTVKAYGKDSEDRTAIRVTIALPDFLRFLPSFLTVLANMFGSAVRIEVPGRLVVRLRSVDDLNKASDTLVAMLKANQTDTPNTPPASPTEDRKVDKSDVD